MRAVAVVVGVILAVAGAALALVPLGSQSLQATSSADGATLVWDNSLTLLPASVTVAWTSSSNIWFFYVTCTNALTASQVQAANFDLASSCTGMKSVGNFTISGVGYDSGTGATRTVSVPGGGSLLFGPLGGTGSPNVSMTLKYPYSNLGFILILVGVVVLLVGVVRRSKRKATGSPTGEEGGAAAGPASARPIGSEPPG